MTEHDLLPLLEPLVLAFGAVDLNDAAAARGHLETRLPYSGRAVQDVRTAAERAAAAGTLLPQEAGGVRFGRLAKDLAGFSVDAVHLRTAGPRHRHPRGEIDLLFALAGDPRFDGHPEGWAVYGPGSEHVPAVTGGEMLILYFLPGGAIEWL